MSVPHLDTRFIDGQKQLLFGPFAGFTTKFLKEGSFMDLFQSLGFNNIVPMMSAGARNIDLTRYLVGQVLLPAHERIAMLRAYYPAAVDEDWALEIAGLRVQIIKGDGHGGGVLKFGTEVVSSADGTMAVFQTVFRVTNGRHNYGRCFLRSDIRYMTTRGCVENPGHVA
jgi:malate dehydrogenase (quinone)